MSFDETKSRSPVYQEVQLAGQTKEIFDQYREKYPKAFYENTPFGGFSKGIPHPQKDSIYFELFGNIKACHLLFIPEGIFLCTTEENLIINPLESDVDSIITSAKGMVGNSADSAFNDQHAYYGVKLSRLDPSKSADIVKIGLILYITNSQQEYVS